MNGARPAVRLVDASAHFLAAQGDDYALDLPPVAKTEHIAGVTASLGADRRLQPGIVAEAVDELGGIGKRRPAGDERRLHDAC